MNVKRMTVTLACTVLVLPVTAFGQAERAESVADTGNIVVASQKSPAELRRDLWRAEKDFYSIYNDLNEDKLYDVRCTKDAPTGSVIKVQTCRPRFIDKALRDGKINRTTGEESDPEVSRQISTFREKLEAYVANNPELRSAATTLNIARARLEANKDAGSKK